MAGSYPDVPDHRMAYDRDGTVGVELNSSASYVSTLSAANLETLNDEGTGYVETDGDFSYVALIFPELRDIGGVMVNMQQSGYKLDSVETSPNTTNGQDGAWTTQTTPTYTDTDNTSDLRNGINAVSWSGVKGIRFRGLEDGGFAKAARWQNIHVFGTPASGEAPDRLLFLAPSTALEVGGAHFDLGDIAQSSTTTVDFQIHNPSATLTANSVTVTIEALTDTSPSNVGQFDFSTDGGSTWASSASLGNLAPGTTSSTITLRRNTSGSAVLSLWWTRLIASASSWS